MEWVIDKSVFDFSFFGKSVFRSFLVLLAALVCMGGFSVTAYAGGGEDIPTDDSGVIVETEPQPLTPEGNMTLVDDIEGEAAEDKQFITVVSKSGNGTVRS